MEKTAVFDIEAVNWTEFSVLGFFDGEDYRVYWSLEHFLEDFLTRKYRGWNCLAHFGGRYDFRFLIPLLVEDGRYQLNFLERGSKILSMKVTEIKSGYTWKFSDSYFLLPASLKDLGKSFNIENMKKDFNFEGVTHDDFRSEKGLSYLMNDCLGLYEILEKFSEWGLNRGKLKLTLPSQSLHIFTTQYLTEKLWSLTSPQEQFVRKTYFGGRVEIFKMYGKDLYYYDFNSLYPSVMLEEMPVGKVISCFKYYPGKIGFYKVRANIPDDVLIPPLPVIRGTKLFFPTGEGEYYTTSAELELLKSVGGEFEVIEGLVFEGKKKIFKEYILNMYEMRVKSERGTLDNFLAKLLMNSLYGKFGQKRDNQELIFSPTPLPDAVPYDEDFGLYLIEKESRGKFILPYLASYITSLARAKLYKLMQRVGFKNIWYCDTDSVITSKPVKTDEKLGGLKLEYNVKEAVFLQPKAYALKTDKGEIIRVKGMRDLKLTLNDFKKCLKEKNVSGIKTEYKNIMGFRETLRREKHLRIKRQTVKKQLFSFYDKRKIINFELTEPFNYNSICNV